MKRIVKIIAVSGAGGIAASLMVRYGVDPALIYAAGFLAGVLTCMVIASASD
jgi:hypothetical protein